MTQHSTPVAPGQRAVAALSIAYLSIDQLKPDPGNARQHSAKQVRQIANSIEAFGFNVPLLVDAEGNVIAGHGRLLAAKRLEWGQVPTIRLDHLSESQRRAFMIADNRPDQDDVYLLDVFRGRLEYPELRRKVIALAREHGCSRVLI